MTEENFSCITNDSRNKQAERKRKRKMTKQDPNNRRNREPLSLPEAYLTQMKALFGEDFPAFLAAMGEPPCPGHPAKSPEM